MENNGNSDGVETLDIIDIADEIVKLTEEVKTLKSKVRLTQAHESRKSDAPPNTNALDINPAIAYINEMLQSSSINIISELKAEFFKLFNFLSSIQTVSPYQRNREQSKSKQIAIEDEFTDENIKEIQETIETEKEMLKLLLVERESLIYELSDQVVAIETEKKELQDILNAAMIDKKKWHKQKEVLERLVTSDPRFNIISLLRRMGVIAPIQLSFVLGVSLSQTRRYINDLEKMKIVKVNEDSTVSLDPSFDEETMNIRIEKNEEK